MMVNHLTSMLRFNQRFVTFLVLNMAVNTSVTFNMPANRLTCAVAVCDNFYYKTKNFIHEGYPITYHYFPRNVELCNRWIKACNRSEEFKTDISFVCSVHFRPEDFIRQPNDSISQQPKRRLKYNVVPTKNLKLNEIRSFSRRNNWKMINGFSDHQEVLEFMNNSSEANNGTEMKNSKNLDNTIEDDIVTMEKNYDKLLKEYEDLESNRKIEIEKLQSIIKEKDELFTMKLKKILSEHLTNTEIDLVMFLRKQKKELAES